MPIVDAGGLIFVTTWFEHLNFDELLFSGLLDLPWWGYVVVALGLTHVTIVAVTVYLHRHQTHRALDLHPWVSHFLRLWLWLTTGMVTREWVAVHRKHHAKVETPEDPHSPQILGLERVLWTGVVLYVKATRDRDAIDRYGHGTPDDWLERNFYSSRNFLGLTLFGFIDVVLFGVVPGAFIFLTQIAWIPFWAAGVINGVGHFWGYRNWGTKDASTNIVPWGVLIGGEELHNNHHTYPTSAKFSVKPYEFDIGWIYISLLEKAGLARVKKTPPKLQLGSVRPVADEKTLEALIANRYEVMASYANDLRRACKAEIETIKARRGDVGVLLAAKRWLPRDADKVPAEAMPQLAEARAAHPVLDKMVTMREELRQFWLNRSQSREQLAADLQGWCRRAEDSGIAALRDFSLRLRAAHA